LDRTIVVFEYGMRITKLLLHNTDQTVFNYGANTQLMLEMKLCMFTMQDKFISSLVDI